MMHPALSGFTLAALFMFCSLASAGLVPSGVGTACEAERQSGYNAGFSDGVEDGFSDGFSDGTDAGIEQCFNDPFSCGITLGSCLAPSQFGETEPNDNMVSADLLVPATNFLGQSLSDTDPDWYYITTTQANQNLTVNFSVPQPQGVSDLSDWSLQGWQVSIRDARGNRLAGFATDFVTVDDPGAGISYRVTLGLIGTYYIVVEPNPDNPSSYPYSLAAFIQDSELDTTQYVVGFFDAEIEPNDVPSLANSLANGVSMYGLINLSFDQAVPGSEGSFVWGQGESDWYVYWTAGNELVNLTFCAREPCTKGNWFVEVYDQPSAAALEGGMPESEVTPLLALNTDVNLDTGGDGADPETYSFGLMEAGVYYMRVDHKRKFEAPCLEYALDGNNDGLVDEPLSACGCDSGDSCDIDIPNPNPAGLCPDGSGTIDDNDGGPQQCSVTCQCIGRGLIVEIPEGDVTSQYNFTWYGTDLPAATVDTDAYQDYLSRPNSLGD